MTIKPLSFFTDFCVKLADLYGVSLDELVGRDK